MGLLNQQLAAPYLAQMQQSPQWAQMAQQYPTIGQSAGAMPQGVPQPGQWYGGSILPQPPQMSPQSQPGMTNLSQQMGQYGMPSPANYQGNYAQPGMAAGMNQMMSPQQMAQRYAQQPMPMPTFADRFR